MVVVEAKCRDGHDWLIEVRDDGPGFPPGYNLLDPTPLTSTKSGGSGIGLAVVRSIAEAHGGSLVIRSTARGSRVAITLPGVEPAHD
jgi:signal transduction histidine kinase